MTKRWMLAAVAAMGFGVGCAHSHHGEDEGEEENEVRMTIDQVPAPVRETLMRQPGGSAIKSVDKEDVHGMTQYEADVMSDGKNWEIRVSPDGKLISRKIDNEEDEKKSSKKHEKEDDDEKEGRSSKKM